MFNCFLYETHHILFLYSFSQADLTPDSLDAMDDGDLRKACQMVLKRDIGPITDSTRDLYKLAVKRALIGHPIVFDSNNEVRIFCRYSSRWYEYQLIIK